MANNVGKTTATVKISDGSILSFFNRGMQLQTNVIQFLDFYGQSRYSVVIPTQYIGKHYRCAHFSRFYGQSIGQSNYPNIMIYVPNVKIELDTYGITSLPLYQFISPNIFKQSQEDFVVTWWSNVQTSESVGGVYDYNIIKKFTSDDIDNLQESTSVSQILCAASVRFEYLRQVGAGLNQTQCSLVPIIYNPLIIHQIPNQGYVTDFSTGGGGGFLSNHTHTDFSQGGFAAAVFMPSANIKPLNWR